LKFHTQYHNLIIEKLLKILNIDKQKYFSF
jgi:hypothetical protein